MYRYDDQGGVCRGCGFRDLWVGGSLLERDRVGHMVKVHSSYLFPCIERTNWINGCLGVAR